MRILLFGGTSGVAKRLLPKLISRGADLTVLTRRPWHNDWPDRVKHHYVDLETPLDNRERDWTGQYDVVIFIPNLIFAPSAWNHFSAKRMIFLSSYNTRVFPHSSFYDPYRKIESKVFKRHPHATILQPTMLTGRGNDEGLCRMIRMVRKLPVMPVIKGDAKVQPLHLDDMARAVSHVVYNASDLTGSYGVGGPDVLTQAELILRIQQATNRPERLLRLPASTQFLASRLKKHFLIAQQVVRAGADKHIKDTHALPGFEPLVSFDEALRKTLEAMDALDVETASET